LSTELIIVKPYPYPRFEREYYKRDGRFTPGSPGGGDALPPFNLVTTDGVWIRNEDVADRKLLITFGSIT
jgi:hypothetical protein